MELSYYIFDWDDNILHMDTRINLEKYEKDVGIWVGLTVSTDEYSIIRKSNHYRIPFDVNGNPDYKFAYMNFNDIYPNDEIFLRDSIIALNKNSIGVSFGAFKNCLLNGHLLAIVTARGHHDHNIKKTIKYIITHFFTKEEKNMMTSSLYRYYNIFNDNTNISKADLLDDYLNNCSFVGISSKEFINSITKYESDNMISETGIDTIVSPEMGKEIAVTRFVNRCIQYSKKEPIDSISIGFSDDDCGNVNAILELFQTNLKLKFPKTKFVLYNTSDKSYIKTVI